MNIKHLAQYQTQSENSINVVAGVVDFNKITEEGERLMGAGVSEQQQNSTLQTSAPTCSPSFLPGNLLVKEAKNSWLPNTPSLLSYRIMLPQNQENPSAFSNDFLEGHCSIYHSNFKSRLHIFKVGYTPQAMWRVLLRSGS